MAVVRRFALALLVGLLWSMRLGAQAPTGTITGRVVDATSQQGVADVSVFVEGTRRGAVTAADGSFTIGGVPAGAQTVRARRIGFNSPAQVVNVPANGSASVVLTAERQAVSLEDVVTTGYGTQRRVAITGSVATVDADKANVGVTTNVNQMIEGIFSRDDLRRRWSKRALLVYRRVRCWFYRVEETELTTSATQARFCTDSCANRDRRFYLDANNRER